MNKQDTRINSAWLLEQAEEYRRLAELHEEAARLLQEIERK